VLATGLAIKNPPKKTQKTALKPHLNAGVLGFIGFFKLTSVFGAKVTIFLVKCL
jgi:hypothetical protein